MNEEIDMDVKEDPAGEITEQERAERAAEVRGQLRQRREEETARVREALEAMKEGKGKLELEKPIEAKEKKIIELPYDFTALTGMEYTEAMDSDPNANSQQIYRISYRQGLSLFARAAAKESDELDMEDIVSRIGITDAAAGVQLATLFFGASIRAGQKRISKKS